MFIKNVTNSYQSFVVGDKGFLMDPGQTLQITDTQAKDETIKLLIARGSLEKVETKKATEDIIKAEEEKKAAEEENKIEVVTANGQTDKTDIAHVVQCSAVKADGSRCSSKISVPEEEFDSDKPYFCGRHKSENPYDYEKKDGVFVKKQKASNPQEKKEGSKPKETKKNQ